MRVKQDDRSFIRSFNILPSQEGQLSVSGKSRCTSTGEPLRELSLPRKSVSRSTDQLNMTITGLTGL